MGRPGEVVNGRSCKGTYMEDLIVYFACFIENYLKGNVSHLCAVHAEISHHMPVRWPHLHARTCDSCNHISASWRKGTTKNLMNHLIRFGEFAASSMLSRYIIRGGMLQMVSEAL